MHRSESDGIAADRFQAARAGAGREIKFRHALSCGRTRRRSEGMYERCQNDTGPELYDDSGKPLFFGWKRRRAAPAEVVLIRLQTARKVLR